MDNQWIYKHGHWISIDIFEGTIQNFEKSPYYNWRRIHDFFKHCGMTSFKTTEVMQKVLQIKHVLNSVTSEQPDNLRVGLSSLGKVDDWNKFWNFIRNYY